MLKSIFLFFFTSVILFALLACEDTKKTSSLACIDPVPDYRSKAWYLEDGTNSVDASVLLSKANGTNVNIALVTDGMDARHCALKDQYDKVNSYNFYTKMANPQLADEYIVRGTAMAGLLVSGFTNKGIQALAPKAKLWVMALKQNITAENIAQAAYPSGLSNATGDAQFNISINSWYDSPKDKSFIIPASSTTANEEAKDWAKNVDRGIGLQNSGKVPKGISYLWFAGDGGDSPQFRDSNLNGYANFYGVMAICAMGGDVKANFSETGSNLFLCAPSFDKAIYTTDVLGSEGLNGDYTNNDFTDRFGDKKYRGDIPTAIAGGVLGLLQSYAKAKASSSTTGWEVPNWWKWRIILAESAKKVDASDSSWVLTRPTYSDPNVKFHHSEKYGFGLISAAKAMQVVDSNAWDANGPTGTATYKIGPAASNLMRDSTGAYSEIQFSSGLSFLLFTEVFVSANMSNVSLTLVSPAGIESHLIPQDSANGVQFVSNTKIRLGSVRDFGSTTGGNYETGKWRLYLKPTNPSDATPDFKEWSLRLVGY